MLSILVIWGLAQASYLLDCADGLLARATGTETRFGEILDHTLDIVSYAFGLAAFFVYVYRGALAKDEDGLAHAALTVGFIFVVARSARYFAWQKWGSAHRPPAQYPWHIEMVLKALMEFQVSMLGVLAFLLSPVAGLLIFAIQTMLHTAAYIRYIVRREPTNPKTDDSAVPRTKIGTNEP